MWTIFLVVDDEIGQSVTFFQKKAEPKKSKIKRVK
jgi:hypothetical protein